MALFAVRYTSMLFCSSVPKVRAAAPAVSGADHSRPVASKRLEDPAHAPIRARREVNKARGQRNGPKNGA